MRISNFKCRFRLLFLLCLASLSVAACEADGFDFASQSLTVMSNGDRRSVQFADRLFAQLSTRNGSGQLRLRRTDEAHAASELASLYVELVPDLDVDYEIRNETKQLALFAKDARTADWLIYSLIDRFAQEQPAIAASDLPPSTLSFVSERKRFAMPYRDPHLSPNLDSNYAQVWGTHSVDRDWGLWGHSLPEVFAEMTTMDVYALLEGKREKTQFCFSAQQTYARLHDYIIEEHGDGTEQSLRFMLAPNDNDLVCSCKACVAAGNTKTSATGALMVLLDRLADAFPKHGFYALGYRTTAEPPMRTMPSNTGVFLSTIALPKRMDLLGNYADVKAFKKWVATWKQRTNQVFLWDYVANFDDYLTPYPSLYTLQQQILFYQKLGVTGLFLNGAGYDYAVFDDVQTYVMAALMREPDSAIDKLVEAYFQRFYPTAGKLLTDFYLDAEHAVWDKQIELPIYASFREAMDSYVDVVKFARFYEDLTKAREAAPAAEKVRLQKLETALSYTQLQWLYNKPGMPEQSLAERSDVVAALQQLEGYVAYTDLKRYKEVGGELSAYVHAWRELRRKPLPDNRLEGIEIPSDSGAVGESVGLLTDGKRGFATDFNQGWWLRAEDVELTASVKDDGMHTLTMFFLVNERHRMLPPEEIVIWLDGVCVAQTKILEMDAKGELARFSCTLPIAGEAQLKMVLKRSKKIKNSVIACDEIQLN